MAAGVDRGVSAAQPMNGNVEYHVDSREEDSLQNYTGGRTGLRYWETRHRLKSTTHVHGDDADRSVRE